MKLSIVSEKENPYMERKELTVKMAHDKAATPSKAAMQAAIAQETKKDVEHVQVIDVQSENGMGSSVGRAYVWKEKKVDDLSKPKETKVEAKAAEAEKK